MLRPIDDFSPAEDPDTGDEYCPSLLIVRAEVFGRPNDGRAIHLALWDPDKGFSSITTRQRLHKLDYFAILPITLDALPE